MNRMGLLLCDLSATTGVRTDRRSLWKRRTACRDFDTPFISIL